MTCQESGDVDLATVEALVVAAQIGIAKVIAVCAVRAEGWIVAGSVVKGGSAFWMVAYAVVGIPRSVSDASTESLLLCALYEWRWATIRGRRWWSSIVGAMGTASGQQTCCGDKGEGETCRGEKFH